MDHDDEMEEERDFLFLDTRQEEKIYQQFWTANNRDIKSLLSSSSQWNLTGGELARITLPKPFNGNTCTLQLFFALHSNCQNIAFILKKKVMETQLEIPRTQIKDGCRCANE